MQNRGPIKLSTRTPSFGSGFVFALRVAGIVVAVAGWLVRPAKSAEPSAGETLTSAEKWSLTFATPQKADRVVDAADLVQWGTWAAERRGAIVVLTDGGILIGSVEAIDTEQLTLDSATFGTVKLSLDRLAGVLFQPPGDRKRRDELIARIVSDTGRTDRLILENRDELTGKLLGFSQGKLTFQGSELAKVDQEKILALRFNSVLATKAQFKDLNAWVGLKDGSRVRAAALSAKNGSCRLTLGADCELKCESKEVVALQPIGGRNVYLSDLKAKLFRHVPYLTQDWSYEVDRNVLGGRLLCGGKTYLKGLGMHSAASISYALDQNYEKFEAEIGIDDVTAGRGSVVFRVLTDDGVEKDGSIRWKARYASEIIRGGAQPVPVSVPITGASRLLLLVDFADRGDELDHADWLNARVVR